MGEDTQTVKRLDIADDSCPNYPLYCHRTCEPGSVTLIVEILDQQHEPQGLYPTWFLNEG